MLKQNRMCLQEEGPLGVGLRIANNKPEPKVRKSSKLVPELFDHVTYNSQTDSTGAI